MAVEPWRDRKRYLWPLGLVVPLFPFIAGVSASVSGWVPLWYLGPFLILVLLPILDLAFHSDQIGPPQDLIKAVEADQYYRWITYLFIPLQYVALLWAALLWGGDELSGWAKLGLAMTVGTVGGIAINTAHELGHKREQHERWLAKIALAQPFYGHFYIEHNRGHHVQVATPKDAASARMGESLYAFLPRAVLVGLRNAWRLEKPRFHRRGQTHWSISNDVLNAWLMSAALWGVLAIGFGLEILPFLLVSAVVSIVLVESVNYVEHYGLLRRREANGRWERVGQQHSWNSNHLPTNIVLYHLQRHSDHHAFPTRRYQALRAEQGAPVLPTGYGGMVVLALVPFIYRRVMDPKVLGHYDGDISRANLQPRKRDAIITKYGAQQDAAA